MPKHFTGAAGATVAMVVVVTTPQAEDSWVGFDKGAARAAIHHMTQQKHAILACHLADPTQQVGMKIRTRSRTRPITLVKRRERQRWNSRISIAAQMLGPITMNIMVKILAVIARPLR